MCAETRARGANHAEGRKQTTRDARRTTPPIPRQRRTSRRGGGGQSKADSIIMRGEGEPPPGPDVLVRGRRARQCTETAVSAEDSAMHAALDAESKTSSPPRPAGDLTSRGGARWLADGGGEGPGGTSARRLPADTRTSSTVAASINCLYQAHAVGGIVRATRTARASSERACDAKLALHAFQGGGGTQRPRERAGRKERASVQRTAFAIVTQVAFLISLFFFFLSRAVLSLLRVRG